MSLYNLIVAKSIIRELIIRGYTVGIQKEWQLTELRQSEENMIHMPMEKEYLFYQAVRMGDLDYVRANCQQQDFANREGMGLLSKNPLTNIKYHFVVTTALITRYCVMAGMAQEQAYRLSDFYILKMDEYTNIEDVISLHNHMVIDFTEQMQLQQQTNNLSKVVTRSVDYIYNNIHSRITVEQLAEYAEVSPSHLSRIFKKELNISIGDYIRGKKIEHAKNLLRYSDYSYVEIANYLAFSSQSHFIQVFEQLVGITPKKFRDKYYKKEW